MATWDRSTRAVAEWLAIALPPVLDPGPAFPA
jgi:hypothetical protein